MLDPPVCGPGRNSRVRGRGPGCWSDPRSWAPREFVERAGKKPLGELAKDCGARFVLVVPVGDPASEVAQGLAASASVRVSDRGALGFRTLQGDASSLMGAAIRKATKGFMAAHSWDVPGAYVPIPRHLLEAACHVVPISKRSGVSFLERISVGAVNGHDIVLRHPSVSKFHAWFEAPEDGHLYVGDAGSRNYTYVNGERITDRFSSSARCQAHSRHARRPRVHAGELLEGAAPGRLAGVAASCSRRLRCLASSSRQRAQIPFITRRCRSENVHSAWAAPSPAWPTIPLPLTTIPQVSRGSKTSPSQRA